MKRGSRFISRLELQRYALSDGKIYKAVAVPSGTAGDALGEFWKLRPFGLSKT